MIRDFHHHPDGVIYVRGNAGVYRADLQTFAADLVALELPAYEGLPANHRERQYQAGQHFLFTANSQSGGAVPWAAGDAYLGAYMRLLERAAARGE